MYEVFSNHGRVEEVGIPAIREVNMIRFVFVCFIDMKESERMATMLDNIFVEVEKIHVNLPRFNREIPHVSKPNEVLPKQATVGAIKKVKSGGDLSQPGIS